MKPWPELWSSAGTTRLAVLDDAFDAVITDQILDATGGQEILDLSIPWSSDKAALIEPEHIIRARTTVDQAGVAVDTMFTVRRVDDGEDDHGTKFKRVYAEARWYNLGTAEPVLSLPATSSPAAALAAVLTGTGWTVGTVSVIPPTGATLSLDTVTTPLAAIRLMPGIFGGEIVFDTIAKTVSLVPERGNPNTGILFAYRSDLSHVTRTLDTTGLLTRVHPIGANGVDITTVNGGVPYLDDYSYFDDRGWPRQIRSGPITNDTITDPTVLLAWAMTQLSVLSEPKVTYDLGVVFLVGDPIPGVGDTVRINDVGLSLDKFARVAQRSLNLINPTASTVQIDTALPMLVNVLPGGVSAVPPVVVPGDTLAPKPPTAVTVTFGDSIDGNGNHIVYGNIGWTAPTQNTNNTPLTDLSHYDVEYQMAGQPAWVYGGAFTVLAAVTGHLWQGGTVNVRVRAVDKTGNVSTWATTSAAVPLPTLTYTAPSTPTLDPVTMPGTIRVLWDGLNDTGGPSPADMAYAEVHMSTTAFGGAHQPSAATMIDQLTGAGVTPVVGLTPGTTYHFVVRYRGTTGTTGTMSPDVSGSPRPIGGADLDPLALADTDHSHLMTVKTTGADFTSTGVLTADAAAPGGNGWQLGGTQAATSVVYTRLKPGRYHAVFMLSNTAAVTGLSAYLADVDVTGTAVVSDGLRNIHVDDLAIVAGYRAVSVNFTVTSPTNSVQLTVTAATGQTVRLGYAWIEPVIVAGALEVRDAMMQSVTISKLTVGTLTADLSVLARIKTADTGARVELSSTGFFAFDAAGTQTVSILGSTGAVVVTGKVQTGTEAPQLAFDPDFLGRPALTVLPHWGMAFPAYLNADADHESEAVLNVQAATPAGQDLFSTLHGRLSLSSEGAQYPHFANGSFETGITSPTGWTYDLAGSGGTYALDTGIFNSGTRSLKITFTSTVGNAGSATTDTFPVTAAIVYTVSAYRRGSAATGTARLRVYWGTTPNFTLASALSFTDIFAATPTTAFVQGLNAAVVAPAGATYARVAVISTSTGVAGSHYWDGVWLGSNDASRGVAVLGAGGTGIIVIGHDVPQVTMTHNPADAQQGELAFYLSTTAAGIDARDPTGPGAVILQLNPIHGGPVWISGTTRIFASGDLSLTSTGHGLQIGLDGADNLRLDTNEIQAVNNGAAADLLLQANGGDVKIGNVTGNNTKLQLRKRTAGVTAASSNFGQVYVASDGALKYLSPGGTISTIVAGP